MSEIGGLPPDMLAVVDSLRTPEQIQEFIDTLEYDYLETCPRETLERGKTECLGGALLAAYCLQRLGYKVWLMELAPRRDTDGKEIDEEHIVAVYEQDGKFGSIAQSKFTGLRSRNPIYSTIKNLALSYQPNYFDLEEGRYTLLSHTDLLSLDNYLDYSTNSKTAIKIGTDLRKAKHYNLIGPDSPIEYIDPQEYWKQVRVIPEATKISPRLLATRP